MEDVFKYIRPELIAPAMVLVYVIQVIKKAWNISSMSVWVGRVLLLVNLACGMGIGWMGRTEEQASLMDAWYFQGLLLGVWMVVFYHGSKWTFTKGNWSLKKVAAVAAEENK